MMLDANTISILAEQIASHVVAAMQSAEQPEYMSREQVAQMLGVSVCTVDRMTAQGKIPAVKLGRRPLYAPDLVHEAIRSQLATSSH